MVMEAADSPGCAPLSNRSRTHAQREFHRQRQTRDELALWHPGIRQGQGQGRQRRWSAAVSAQKTRSGLHQDDACQTVGSPASNARQLHT